MKKLLIALAALTALSAAAYAQQCTTTCYWLGNQQICNTQCYAPL